MLHKNKNKSRRRRRQNVPAKKGGVECRNFN